MFTVPTPREVALRLLDAVTGGRPADAAALYAEDAHVTHPFGRATGHWSGGRGRPGIFAAGAAVRREFAARDVVIHETGDPEVVIAEFAYHGRVPDAGRSFVVPCVFVVRVRNGLIVEPRDYADHLAMAYALGRVPELVRALGASAASPPGRADPDRHRSVRQHPAVRAAVRRARDRLTPARARSWCPRAG